MIELYGKKICIDRWPKICIVVIFILILHPIFWELFVKDYCWMKIAIVIKKYNDLEYSYSRCQSYLCCSSSKRNSYLGKIDLLC